MAEHSILDTFLDTYQTAFERFDAKAVVKLFSYPCHVTGAGPSVTVLVVTSEDAWLPRIEQLLAAYDTIGVRSARRLDVHATALAERLIQATVRWRLSDESGQTIYDFDASYTLVDFGEGLSIASIAHNETPLLLARMQRAQSGSGQGTS